VKLQLLFLLLLLDSSTTAGAGTADVYSELQQRSSTVKQHVCNRAVWLYSS
jgi:hypothetical protein